MEFFGVHHTCNEEHYCVINDRDSDGRPVRWLLLAQDEETASSAAEYATFFLFSTNRSPEDVVKYLLGSFSGLDLVDDNVENLLPRNLLRTRERAQEQVQSERDTMNGIGRSFVYEVSSNSPLAVPAVMSSWQEVLSVLAYSLFVIGPQAFDFAVSFFRKVELEAAIESYDKMGNSEAFVGKGLLLSAGSKDVEDHKRHHWALIPIYDVAYLLPNHKLLTSRAGMLDIKNYGLPGHALRYAGLTAAQLKSTASDLSKYFWKTARKEGAYVGAYFTLGLAPHKRLGRVHDFFNAELSRRPNVQMPDHDTVSVSQDVQGSAPRRMIRTRLHYTAGNASVMHIPTSLRRLKKAQRATRIMIAVDWVKIIFNGAAIYGIGEFCYGAGGYAVQNIESTISDPSWKNATLSAVWGLATIVGAAASRHFFEDREKIHVQLGSKEAQAAIKNEVAIHIRQRLAAIRSKVSELEHAQDKKGDDEKRGQLAQEILAMCSDIDFHDAADQETKRKVAEIIMGIGAKRGEDSRPGNRHMDRSP